MHGEYKVPGGKLVVADVDTVDGCLVRVQISGDFFLEPASALDAIDAALEGQPCSASVDRLEAAVAGALPAGTQLYGITCAGVAIAVRRAIESGDAPRPAAA